LRVKFFAFFRDDNYTGCSEIEVPVVPTIGDLVRMLSERYGSSLRDKILTSSGELGPDIIIMINGRHTDHLGGIDAPLKDDDIVQIFPKIAGG
jgi:molybdopterin synthase sulfur carrier subunit